MKSKLSKLCLLAVAWVRSINPISILKLSPLLLLLASLATWPRPAAAQWIPLTNGTPSARGYTAMAEDAARNKIVLFGGTPDGTSALDDTWEWALPDGPWQPVATIGPRPPARFVHGLAVWSNGTASHSLLFGGASDTGSLLGDTWTWDGATWQAVSAAGPSPRVLLAMAAEPLRQRVLLFGGYDGGALLGDTWRWDGADWNELPVAGPSPRAGHALAYDADHDKIILFGGQDATGYRNDTWSWDGAAWSLVGTNGPVPRRDHALAHRGHRVVLYGGIDAANLELADTWEWDGAVWTQTVAGCPSARSTHVMASDSSTGGVLMYGGSEGTAFYADTWRYNGPLIQAGPSNVVAIPGQPASFSVQVSGASGAPTYQWERDCGGGFQAIAGATSATYTLSSVTTNDACLYRCVVQVLGCAATSQAAQLTVPANGAPFITLQPQSLAVTQGETATFSVAATGAPLTYQWRFGTNEFGPFTPIPDATNATLIISHVQPSDYGSYQVVVSNSFGATVSATALLAPVFTTGSLFCRDGTPITNCTVTVTLTNSAGATISASTTMGTPGCDNCFAVYLYCQGRLDLSLQWWFVVRATCCTNVWTIPTTTCYRDLGPLICTSCGICPTPAITCPSGVVAAASCNQTCVAVTYPAPTVSVGALESCTPPSGSCFPVGTTFVTCRATNTCGDAVTCQFPVTVKPCLSCATNKTVECGSAWDFDPPIIAPGCQPLYVAVISTVTNGICPKFITRNWLIINECNIALHCSQTVTVIDTTRPAIACSPDKSVSCGSPWTFDPPSLPDDPCGPLTVRVLSTVTNGLCSPLATITRTWIVTDPCGNSSQCSQQVYVAGDDVPVVVCASNKTVQCGTNWDFDPPTVSGTCSAVTTYVLSTTTNGVCPVSLTRTWQVVDQCEHSAVCSQTVIVQGAAMLQTPFTIFSGRDVNGLLPLGAPDTQFSLSCAPAGVSVTTPVVVQPHRLWLPNDANSRWIGPDASNQGPGGVYCYTFNFTLPPCPDGTPVYSLTGRWAGDDTGTIHLNGSPTGVTLPNGWAFTNWHPISITSGLVPGPNSLTFYITNASAGPTGLRLELTASASCCGCTTTNCGVAILCPPDIDRHICGTQGHVVFTPPVPVSNCGLPVALVCVPGPSSVYPLGTNIVNCYASDPLGHTAACSFKVILRPDDTPPTIDCACLQAQVPPRINACSAVVPDLCHNTECFSDNCTPASQLLCTQSPPAGTVLPSGTSYVITVTVTDAAGNSNQCQVGFSVVAPIQTRVWNTGGSPLDPNFVVVQTPGGPVNWPAQNTALATGAWLPNTAASSWISFLNNSYTAAPGTYVYRLKFDLVCTNDASIVGRFLADDTATILLNGQPTAAYSASYTAWAPVTLTSGFVLGQNTLDLYVTNGPIWTGFRAELTNSFSCCCPVQIECPSNVVRSSVCPIPIAGIAVFYPPPRPWLPCVTTTCTPPSGSLFPVGTTTVNCAGTDALGNVSTCSFTVTVIQLPDPLHQCDLRPLNISLAGPTIVLSWPEYLTTAILQETDELLGSATVWKTVTNIPTNAEGSNLVTLPPQHPLRFYRLEQTQ